MWQDAKILAFISAIAGAACALAAETRPASPRPSLEVREIRMPKTLVSFKMIRIPAGTIEMPPLKEGDKPGRVEIKSFWIGQTEVTWEQMDVYSFGLDIPGAGERQESIGTTHPTNTAMHYALWGLPEQHHDYPVAGVHSNLAQQYCKWLSSRTRKRFRLPTEAEWEYACLGAAPAIPKPAQLLCQGWFSENSVDDLEIATTHPVAMLEPNGFGLYDMLGNVAEWVSGSDGQPVTKGGSCLLPAQKVSIRFREPYNRAWQARDARNPKHEWWLSDGPHIGFRIVMEDDR